MAANKKNPLSLMRDNIRNLSPYSTARDEYDGPLGIYLDANENPYDNGYNRYPDPHQKALKVRISEIKNIAPERIFIGNGSDEAIDLSFRVFCVPGVDNAVSISPTYGMYRVAAATNDVEIREVELGADDDFALDPDALLSVCDEHTKLMFVCSPNNPTGNCFPTGDIEYLLDNFDGMVVLDEAYIDFAGEAGMLTRLDEYPNLIILQTLSKAWGMAGLRLGMAFASADVISVFSRVKYPYNINGITQRLVLEQLRKDVSPQVTEVVAERERVTDELKKQPIVRKVWPTNANFVLVRFDAPAEVYAKLIGAGIIVRDRSHIAGCEGCLRITVGTPDENTRMLNVIKNI